MNLVFPESKIGAIRTGWIVPHFERRSQTRAPAGEYLLNEEGAMLDEVLRQSGRLKTR